MKKSLITSILVILMLFTITGCGSSSEKGETSGGDSNLKNDITSFIKSNMVSDWTYTNEKLKVNDDNSVEIIFNNVEDWSGCGYSANIAAVKLASNKNEILNKIPTITFICRNSELVKVAKSEYTNLYNITLENVESNVKYYDANDNQINDTVENGYKNSCSSYTYKEIFRNPEDYLGKKIKITGEVIQVMEQKDSGKDYWLLRVNMTKDEWGYYDDTVMVWVEKSVVKGRIIEDDIFTFYGQILEPTTYTTVLGADQTVPTVLAQYATLVS